MAEATAKRSLWRHRDFCLLWAGQSLSRVGSQVSILAIPLVAIQVLHASTFEVGSLTAFETLPFLLVGLPAGAWVDRLRRRPVLIIADMARFAALGSVPLSWSLGGLTIGQLYAVSLVAGTLTVFFDVAYQSYLPVLIERDQLVDGNAKLAATDSGAQVAGPGLAGLLIGAVGAANAVIVDAASYVVSFLTLIFIRTHEVAPSRRRGDTGTTLRSEIAQGLRFVLGEPRIRSVAGATATSNLCSSMGQAVLLVFAVRQLGLGAGRLGAIFALGNVGALVGALTASRIARHLGLGPTIMWSIALSGLGALAYPLATRNTATLLLLAGMAVASSGAVVYNINQVSLRQALCPLALQGRMNASVRFLIWGTLPIGGFLGAVLGSALGLRITLWIAGVGGLGAFLWILPSPVPHLREMPDQVALESFPLLTSPPWRDPSRLPGPAE